MTRGIREILQLSSLPINQYTEKGLSSRTFKIFWNDTLKWVIYFSKEYEGDI